MPTLEFFGQSAQDSDNIAANPARLVNCYLEPIVSGGRSALSVKSVLGLQPFSSFPGVWTRAVEVVDGKLFAVAGAALYEIASDGGYTIRGAILDAENTTLAGNNGDVTVVAGGNYYVWNGTTLTNPAAGAFSAFGSHDYIGNYTVITENNGRRFQWSDVANPSSLPGLNFSTADGRDDNLIRPFAINGVLYLFKETSHEVWYLTGGAGALAFERQAGGVVDIGLKAHNLITRIPGAAFFIGDDNRAHLVSGQVQPVSIPPVETAIKECEPRACFTYEDEGHTFCVITFRDCAAWVYDVALGQWHERAEGAELLPWSASCSTKFGGEWYCGRDDATLLKFAKIGTDNNGPLVREAISRTLYQDGQRFVVSEIELFPRQGFQDATLELFVSRDGGLTWTDPKPRQIGPTGGYANRVIWRSLGQCRQITAKVRFSEAQDFTMNAEGRLA